MPVVGSLVLPASLPPGTHLGLFCPLKPSSPTPTQHPLLHDASLAPYSRPPDSHKPPRPPCLASVLGTSCPGPSVRQECHQGREYSETCGRCAGGLHTGGLWGMGRRAGGCGGPTAILTHLLTGSPGWCPGPCGSRGRVLGIPWPSAVPWPLPPPPAQHVATSSSSEEAPSLWRHCHFVTVPPCHRKPGRVLGPHRVYSNRSPKISPKQSTILAVLGPHAHGGHRA